MYIDKNVLSLQQAKHAADPDLTVNKESSSTCAKDAGRKYIGGTQMAIFWLKSRDQELSNSI